MKKNLSNREYTDNKTVTSVTCLGRIDKGESCSVSGCKNVAERSMNADKCKAAGLNVSSSEKRAYLCKEHYKELKKKTKKDKTLDKWRFG